MPPEPSCSLEPNQVEFASTSLICDSFMGELIVGYVGEWDLSSENLIEHKVHDGDVFFMALDGEMIVTCDNHQVYRLFDISTCLLVLLSCSH